MPRSIRSSWLFAICLSLCGCHASEEKSIAVATSKTASSSLKDTLSTIEKKDTSIVLIEATKPPHKKIKSINQEIEAIEIHDAVSVQEQNNILPGSATNTYRESSSSILFQSIVIEDQDLRVGCSGGGNKLTFSIPLTPDSFSYTNASLQTLQLKYRIDGGMYFASGENPKKGKIAGRKKDNSTWIVEMDILIPMHADQSQQEERPIKRKIEFSKAN